MVAHPPAVRRTLFEFVGVNLSAPQQEMTSSCAADMRLEVGWPQGNPTLPHTTIFGMPIVRLLIPLVF